jgi:sulfate adenylyltransferase subunit 1 (EFTu-like GTPase family)
MRRRFPMAGRRGYRTITVQLKKEVVPVRASARVADALEELSADMDLYQGAKLHQVLESVDDQGVKNGRLEVFERFAEIQNELPHRPSGRPKKRKPKK